MSETPENPDVYKFYVCNFCDKVFKLPGSTPAKKIKCTHCQSDDFITEDEWHRINAPGKMRFPKNDFPQ